jgi:hypothetical protein
MNLHHQNVKALCQQVEQWIQRHLHQLGVTEFACNFLDIQQGTFLPLGNGYRMYCEYMAQGHQYQVAQRLKPGIRVWQPNESLQRLYRTKLYSNQAFYKIDLTVKTPQGFELFVVASHKPISMTQFWQLIQAIQTFSALGQGIAASQPNALLELPAADAIIETYHQFKAAPWPHQPLILPRTAMLP